MKITFENPKDYIEFETRNEKIEIIISARDGLNNSKSIINSVKLNEEQLIQLIESVGLKIEK